MLWLLILSMTQHAGHVTAQVGDSTHHQQITAYQQKLNGEFMDPDESPLTDEDREQFKGLPFFPIDTSYRTVATIERTPKAKPFRMATTTDRAPMYRQYALAYFSIDGQPDTLRIYQNMELMQIEKLKDYLFTPFTDLTNGFGSYGGGRYLDLRKPLGNSIVLDFNKAYNPYCAYNHRYSCPIPPRENHLNIAIKAGVKNPSNY
ncbi:MAG: DUF1684 domain-containing protein [Owenweeksia sp.]|nr:DUF1684 domain-containing protein [Owenweeksia sp.]